MELNWFEKWLYDYDNKPPIVYPFVWATWLAILIIILPLAVLCIVGFVIYQLIYKLPMLLIGFWWCSVCKKRFYLYKNRRDLKEYVGRFESRFHPCCIDCHNKKDGEW